VSAGGYHHHIRLNTWESRGGAPPPPGSTGLFHVAILYPSRALLADALGRLLAASIPLDGASDHGVSEAIYLRDPDGNPERYALGPGGLDWATQPNPFRRFDGSPVLKLPLANRDDTPPAAVLFGENVAPPRAFTLDALGLFFELSMGLSARKEIPGMSWYLRINPSSGNLHPTEAYWPDSALKRAAWPRPAGDRRFYRWPSPPHNPPRRPVTWARLA